MPEKLSFNPFTGNFDNVFNGGTVTNDITIAKDAPVFTLEDTGGTIDWTFTVDSDDLTIAPSSGVTPALNLNSLQEWSPPLTTWTTGTPVASEVGLIEFTSDSFTLSGTGSKRILNISPDFTMVGVGTQLSAISLFEGSAISSSDIFYTLIGLSSSPTITQTVNPFFANFSLFYSGPTIESATNAVKPAELPVAFLSEATVEYSAASGTASMVNGFTGFYSGTFVASGTTASASNGATFNIGSQVNFRSNDVYRSAASSTLNITTIAAYDVSNNLQTLSTGETNVTDYSFYSGSAIIGGGATVTNQHKFLAEDLTGTGTITNNYGLYIQSLSFGTNNYGIWIENADQGAIILDQDGIGGRIYFGEGQDAGIDYDGTNLIIDPAIAGTGAVKTNSGRIKNTTRVTTTYTVLVTDDQVFANSDGGSYTVTLPAGVEGQTFRIINSGSSGNTVTVDGNGSETIYSSLTHALADNESVDITWNATDGWM